VAGIGDDAAVLAPERGTVDVVTVDSQIEDIHFRRAWTVPRDIGHKAFHVCVSDLAAMGATPRAVLLSLALPPSLPLAEFDGILDGFLDAAAAVRTPLVGGNITRSPGPIVIDVTAIGAARPRRLLRRSGARAGDQLYVTGSVGGAAAGLGWLAAGHEPVTLDEDGRACLDRYARPEARLRCGWIIARTGAARACVDLSDGLADAARQIAEASGLGVVIEADRVPVHAGARAWAEATGRDPVVAAVAGGDDYELLFAVASRRTRMFEAAARRCRGLAVTHVGRLTADEGAWLDRHGRQEPLPQGFVHY
jgi:thiamine-monophosphate kinase